MGKRLRVGFILVICLALIAQATPASACSCAVEVDPRDSLAYADGAIVGTLKSKKLAEEPKGDYFNTGADTIYTFRVDEAFKGTFDDRVQVHSAFSGASCGLEVRIGKQTGLFLYERKGEWHSSLCSQISPEELREAAAPLPEPNGEGPIKMLVGGSLGEAEVIALDSEGRTLSYGFGNHRVGLIEMCPGSQRFVAFYQNGYRRPFHLVLRETESMEVIRDTKLPVGKQPYGNQYVTSAGCRDPAGDHVYVFSTNYRDELSRSYLFDVTAESTDLLDTGTGFELTFAGDVAYMAEGEEGRELVRLNLLTMQQEPIASVPRYPREIDVSRDQTRLAFTTGFTRPRVVIVDLNTSPPTVVKKRLSKYDGGELLWIDDATLAFLPRYEQIARIFDRDLQQLDEFEGWSSSDNAIVDGEAFGIGWRGLLSAPLPEGPATLTHEFGSPALTTVTSVPDKVNVKN